MSRLGVTLALLLAGGLNSHAKALDIGPAPTGKEVYSTAQAISAVVCPDCIRFAPVGICFFLVCTP